MKFLAILLAVFTSSQVFAGHLGAPTKTRKLPASSKKAAHTTNNNELSVALWDKCSYKTDLIEIYFPHWPGGRTEHDFYCDPGHTHVAAVHLEKGCEWDARSRIACQRGVDFSNMIHCDSYIFAGCATVHMVCCTREADRKHVKLANTTDVYGVISEDY